jgi:SPP1 family predicted phage head-tail adaptor
MIRAGELRHQLVIHTPVQGQSTLTGAPIASSYSTLNVWGGVDVLKGYELFAASQREAKVDAKIVLRYTTGVNNQSIVVVNGSTYEVVGIVNVQERNLRLELLCTKVVE